jgi:putative ABC transport system permease protein
MSAVESIRMAFRSLSANVMRSALTMLGIVIGTGAVIALLAVGQGAREAITSQIQGIGSNLIIVFAGDLTGDSTDAQPLTRNDALALANPALAPHVSAVAPVVSRSARVTYGAQSANSQVEGTTPDYEYVRNSLPTAGRFITEADEAVSARVAVIGWGIAEELVGDPFSAVGLTVRLNGIPFEVVGVLEQKGGGSPFGGGMADATVLVPLSTAHTRLFPGRFVSGSERTLDVIYLSVVDEDSIDLAVDEVTQVMRQRQGTYLAEDDGFTITTQEDVLGVFDQVTSILTTFLAAIAGISLLVGGIGIMNIMLVSVTERTREIGIRKAVGARRSDVLMQFLIESVVLSVIGGLLGIAFGWGVSRFVNSLGTFTAVVSPDAVALAVGFSLAVGLFFGIYPARRAASMNPIDALRYE